MATAFCQAKLENNHQKLGILQIGSEHSKTRRIGYPAQDGVDLNRESFYFTYTPPVNNSRLPTFC